jgi:thioredoxin 1
MANEKVLSDSNFEQEVKQAKGLVLVDFYADWCMPCRMLGPIVHQLSDDYAGKLTVGKLDVDKNFNTAAAFSVSGIPTLILFKDGQMAERLVGLQPIDALKSVIDKHLAAK